jgi:cytoskeletal protein RodZ
MESAGDEKRIQALFSDSSVQDRSVAPRFERLWANAEMTPARVRGIRRPMLAIVVVVMIAALSFASWSWRRSTQRTTQQLVNATPQNASPASSPRDEQQQGNETTAAVQPRVKHQAHNAKLARLRRVERATTTDATQLSQWQSPTQLYLQSPATIDFSSLPQLNQSAEELKQFLPRNADPTKE